MAIEHSNDDQYDRTATVSKLILSVLSLGAGMVGGPGFVAAAGALGVSAAMLDYIQDMPLRALGKVKAATDEAVITFGDPEKLMEAIAGDERLLWLFDTTVSASARAATEAKARALGRALANGALAADDAQFDQAAQMVRILADLEPIDVRVLAVRADPETTTDQRLVAALGLSDGALMGALAVLDRNGLVNSRDGGTAAITWPPVTELGHAVLSYLSDRA